MGRLFFLFFMLPWWVYIPAAIGVYWVGERAYEQALEKETQKAAALEQAMPGVVDLAVFDRSSDIHAAGEVHVSGWLDAEMSYELVRTRNGVTTSKRYMYPMFGPSEPTSTREVRAALMLTKGQYEKFMEYGDDHIVGLTGADKLVFEFNGFGKTYVTMSDMASDAFEELGLEKSPEFIFVEPFFDGREAALSPQGVSDQTRLIGWVAAAVVALIGVFKRVMSVRARPAPGEAQATGLKSQEELASYIPPPPEEEDMASGFAVPEGVSDDTPLGRLARKSRALQTEEEPLRYTAYSAAEPEEDDSYADADDTFEAARFDEPDDASGPRFAEPGEETYTYADTGYAAAAGETRPQSSAGAFYAKLALGMILVGGLAYDPSLLNAALPFAGLGLVLFGVFVVMRKIRGVATRAASAVAKTPRHTRRPDAGAKPVTAGGMDIGSPVQSSRRERGVI